MSGITNALETLGSNFYLVLFGCIEIVFAVVLFAAVSVKKRAARRWGAAEKGASRVMFRELAYREDEVCVLMRRSDSFQVAAVGDIESLIGISLEKFRRDASSFANETHDPAEGEEFLHDYAAWDGAAPLTRDLQMKNGKWIRVSTVRCHDDAHNLIVFSDITEMKKKEAAYEERLSAAEAQSQFKTSFLFRMSHEIRTPMNGITGMLTLAKEKLTPEHPAMQYLEKADDLSAQLLSLINDILDMSRIEAGKVVLERRAFSLKAFGGKIYNMFFKTLETKGIKFDVNFEALDVDYVVGDELRISQVVVNFLSNAVKFTSSGEVIVTFRQMLVRDGVIDLMIRVHDTGIGMNPEFISRIFKPFEQEDASTTRRFGGTGLGMAISDQLVRLMDGQIVVNSLPGKGSDFTVFLPLPIAEDDAVRRAKDQAALAEDGESDDSDGKREYRILMAEDNETNAMIAVELLSQRGAAVDVAVNGEDVIKKFADAPQDYYDVILMDIQMPVMDGRTAAEKIRKLDRPDAARVPILALSADAFVEDERLSLESGMNGHFAKPIDFDALWQKVRELTGNGGSKS